MPQCHLPEGEDGLVHLPPTSMVSRIRGFACELVRVGRCLVAGAQGRAAVAALCLPVLESPGCAVLHPGPPGWG